MSLKQNTTDLQAALAAITGLPDYIDPAAAPIPADAIAALTEKGVDVEGGADVSTLAGLIAAIEAGGGGLKATWGTVTLAEEVTLDLINSDAALLYEIEHGLGEEPDAYMIVRDQLGNGSGQSCIIEFIGVTNHPNWSNYVKLYFCAFSGSYCKSLSEKGNEQYRGMMKNNNVIKAFGNVVNKINCQRMLGTYTWLALKQNS
jgi:hypothetical protein